MRGREREEPRAPGPQETVQISKGTDLLNPGLADTEQVWEEAETQFLGSRVVLSWIGCPRSASALATPGLSGRFRMSNCCYGDTQKTDGSLVLSEPD